MERKIYSCQYTKWPKPLEIVNNVAFAFISGNNNTATYLVVIKGNLGSFNSIIGEIILEAHDLKLGSRYLENYIVRYSDNTELKGFSLEKLKSITHNIFRNGSNYPTIHGAFKEISDWVNSYYEKENI